MSEKQPSYDELAESNKRLQEQLTRTQEVNKTLIGERLKEEAAEPEEQPQEPTEIEGLSHLNVIEDPPRQGGSIVTVPGVVSSTSLSYLVPKEATASWITESEILKTAETTVPITAPENMAFVQVSEATVRRLLARMMEAPPKASVEVWSYRTVYKLRVRPPVFTLERRDDKIVDERGFEYKAYDVYVVSERRLDLQPSSLVHVRGQILPDPKTQKATLLADYIKFPESVEEFNRNTLAQLYEKFAGKTVRERLAWILDNFEGFSQVVSRRNVAYAALLAYFTPIWIRFTGNQQRGWGLVMIIGDSTTGKSETVRRVLELLQAGTLITAETATAVGLTGTATQMEGGEWFTDWGFLVLNDRRLLAIDGAQKLSHEAWATLAETERNGVMIKASASKGSAPARTRQIKIANPVDEEAGRYSTKTLGGFLYPAQALTTVLDVTSIARLDLAVFSDQRAVKAKEINKAKAASYDPDLLLIREAMKWTWSSHAQVTFEEEAVELLLEEATALYNQFKSPSVPLVSIDMKWKLARLSSALAALTLSTGPEFDQVMVTREHVEEVVAFLREEYVEAGLATLSKREEFEAMEPEDAVDILSELSIGTEMKVDRVVSILLWLPIVGGATRDQIKEKFNLAENSELRPLLAVLRNENLAGGNRGLVPSAKHIELFKLLEGPHGGEIISKAKALYAQHFTPRQNPGQKTIDAEEPIKSNKSNTLKNEPPPNDPYQNVIPDRSDMVKKGPPPNDPETRQENSVSKALRLLVGSFIELQNATGEAVKAEDLDKHITTRFMWTPEYVTQIRDVAAKDGTIFSPRPGYWRLSQ